MTIDEACSLERDEVLVMASRFDRTRGIRQLVVKGIDRAWQDILANKLAPYTAKPDDPPPVNLFKDKRGSQLRFHNPRSSRVH